MTFIYLVFLSFVFHQTNDAKLCGEELIDFKKCLEPKFAEIEDFDIGLNFIALEKRLKCFENHCKKPKFLSKTLKNGIFCLGKLAKKMAIYVGECMEYKLPSFNFTVVNRKTEIQLLANDFKNTVLSLQTMPDNLTSLVASLVQGTKKMRFNPIEEIEKAALDTTCSENQRGKLIECFKKNPLAYDRTLHLLRTGQMKQKFCSGRATCLQKFISDPVCIRTEEKQRCNCAKEVLGWLELEEHRGKWKLIKSEMTSCWKGFPDSDLDKSVLEPLLRRFFCPESLMELGCSPEALFKMPAIWLWGLEPLEVGGGPPKFGPPPPPPPPPGGSGKGPPPPPPSVRGIHLDGTLPTG